MTKPIIKRRLPRAHDPVQLAKLVGHITAGQARDDKQPTADDVRRVMSMLGKIGGPKGGAARAKKLSPKKRSEIARRAAIVRWSSKDDDSSS